MDNSNFSSDYSTLASDSADNSTDNITNNNSVDNQSGGIADMYAGNIKGSVKERFDAISKALVDGGNKICSSCGCSMPTPGCLCLVCGSVNCGD